DLVKTRDALKTAQAGVKQAQAERDAGVATLKEVGELVGSDFTDLKTSREGLLRDVRDTARMAKVVDPKGMMRDLQRELEADRAKLAQRWEPAQMLGFWAPVLDAHRDRKDLAASALKDAQRVLDDPKAKGEARGQALLIQGLALRNEEKFAE